MLFGIDEVLQYRHLRFATVCFLLPPASQVAAEVVPKATVTKILMMDEKILITKGVTRSDITTRLSF